MFRKSHVEIPRSTTHLAKRLAQPFFRRKLFHAARVLWPTLVALTFASVAHAQGTMDFSGAQTLMGTFNVITMLESRRRFEMPSALCSARAREIATTAQRMIARRKIA